LEGFALKNWNYYQIIPMVLVGVIGLSLMATASTPANSTNGCVNQTTGVLKIKETCSEDEYSISLSANSPTSYQTPMSPSQTPSTTPWATPTNQPTNSQSSTPTPVPTNTWGQEENFVGFKNSYTCGKKGDSKCRVGALGPGGGSIFFVDYNDEYDDFDFLEASPLPCVKQVPFPKGISSDGEALQNTSADEGIGSGESNTEVLVQSKEFTPAQYAHKLGSRDSDVKRECLIALKKGREDAKDWFLPSVAELDLLLTSFQYDTEMKYMINQTEYWTVPYSGAFWSSSIVNRDRFTYPTFHLPSWGVWCLPSEPAGFSYIGDCLWDNRQGFLAAAWAIRSF
jgi:hypothetical protein